MAPYTCSGQATAVHRRRRVHGTHLVRLECFPAILLADVSDCRSMTCKVITDLPTLLCLLAGRSSTRHACCTHRSTSVKPELLTRERNVQVVRNIGRSSGLWYDDERDESRQLRHFHFRPDTSPPRKSHARVGRHTNSKHGLTSPETQTPCIKYKYDYAIANRIIIENDRVTVATASRTSSRIPHRSPAYYSRASVAQPLPTTVTNPRQPRPCMTS